jgi:hypothetical protein
VSVVSHSKRFAIALVVGISVLVVAPQASAQKSSRVRWQVRDKMRGLDQADDGLGHAMLLSPNGGGSPDGSQGFALVAHDAQTGALRWVSASSTGAWALDMAISPDGSRIFVAGSEGLRPAHFMTAAFDAETGARIWARQYLPNPSGGGGAPMTVATDGTLVFVTSAFPQVSGPASWDYGTIAYDAATGTLLCVRRMVGCGGDAGGAPADPVEGMPGSSPARG